MAKSGQKDIMNGLQNMVDDNNDENQRMIRAQNRGLTSVSGVTLKIFKKAEELFREKTSSSTIKMINTK